MSAHSYALRRIFEDTDLKEALEDFFAAQSAMEATASTELMGMDIPPLELARKHACYAKAFEEAMHRLREYAQQV